MPPSYLRFHGSNWWLKYPIPRRLRHLYLTANGKQRTHIEESLGTADRKTADRLKHVRIAIHVREFEQREAGMKGDLPPRLVEAGLFRKDLLRATNEGDRDLVRSLAEDRAEEIEKELGYEKAKQWYDYAVTTTTLRETWNAYMAEVEHNKSTKVKDEQAFQIFTQFIATPDAPPVAITTKTAQAYVDWLNKDAKSARGGPLAYATKLARISPLRSFWKDYLIYRDIVTKNPWLDLKITGRPKSTDLQPNKKRPYTEGEILSLLNGPEVNDREDVRYPKRTLMELYALGFYTGTRISEMANRTLGDLERIRGGYKLHIRVGKRDYSIRSIPILHPIPVAVLKRRIGKRTDPEAQLFEEFIPGGPERSLAWYPSKALGRYRDKVGLGTAVDTHSTRRQFISLLINKGLSLPVIQYYVGHKPPGVTAGVYGQAMEDGAISVAKAITYSAPIEKAFRAALGPGGHLKLLHLWPGQTPPPRTVGRRDFSWTACAWQPVPRLP